MDRHHSIWNEEIFINTNQKVPGGRRETSYICKESTLSYSEVSVDKLDLDW